MTGPAGRAVPPAGFASLLLAPFALTACAITPPDDRDSWRPEVPVAADADPHPDRPLGVAGSMRLAAASHESLGIEGEALVRAIVARRRAAAAFLPSVSLSAEGFLSEALAEGRRSAVDVPLDASITTNPVSNGADERRTDAVIAERRALLRSAQDDLLLDTARAHFAAVRAERRADVLRNSIAVQEAAVADARARVEAGVSRPLELALSESRAATTRSDLVAVETAARNARTALSFLTSRDLAARPLDGDFAHAVTPPPRGPLLDAAVDAALRRRADAEAAAAAERAADAAAEAAAGRAWPSISADLSVFLSRTSEPADQDWRSFVSVRLPLFERGLVEADVRDALSRVREARLRSGRLAREIRRDVETSAASIEGAARRIAALRVRADTAKRALEQAEGLREAGLSTHLERLRAQDDLLGAELALADAELERRLLHLEFARASGSIREAAGLPAPHGEGGDAGAR